MPFHLPGHKYLGPGTSDFSADPVDADDRIAREHDLNYKWAVDPREIDTFDKQAIGDFWKDFKTSGNWHSLLGASGLGLKHGLESLIGRNVYPSMKTTDRSKIEYGLRQRYIAQYARENNISFREAQARQRSFLPTYAPFQQALSDLRGGAGPSGGFERASDRLNRQRGINPPLATSTPTRPGTSAAFDDDWDFDTSLLEDIDNQQHPGYSDSTLVPQQQGMDTVDNPAGQSSGSSGGGGQVIGGPSVMGQSASLQILHNPIVKPSSFVIRHSHLFQSWGYKFQLYENNTVNGKSHIFHYPLALLPVDIIPFYMTHSEWSNIPTGSYIEEVFVKVTPKGVRCSFDTGTTMSGTANAQQTIFGVTSIGLNHKYLLRHRKIKPNEGDHMNPDYEEITRGDILSLEKRMWGASGKDRTFPHEMPTCMWATRSLPFYAGIYIPAAEGNTSFTMDTGLTDLTRHTNVFNILDHKDEPCINYRYKPRFAPLKVKQHISGTDSVVRNDQLYMSNATNLSNVLTKIDGGKMSVDMANDSLHWKSYTPDYYSPLEQSSFRRMPNREFFIHTQPQVHLGILPVQSNAPSDTDSKFVNASGVFYVETEIRIGANIGSLYNRADVASHMDAVYTRDYDVPSLFNIEHYQGMLATKSAT